MEIVWPHARYLDSYADALRRGWSPDNLRPEAAEEELAEILANPVQFVAEQVDREGKGSPILLPDGRYVPRLPGFHLWIWDGEFCGLVGFRWQPGTTDLPPTCLGHMGYAVVPWKRNRGYATQALAAMLIEARQEALPFVELTTDVSNVASQRVIEANGGVVHERFFKPASYGGAESLRYRIYFDG